MNKKLIDREGTQVSWSFIDDPLALEQLKRAANKVATKFSKYHISADELYSDALAFVAARPNQVAGYQQSGEYHHLYNAVERALNGYAKTAVGRMVDQTSLESLTDHAGYQL